MAWANEPVVFTSLTIHFHVVNIVKVKGNNEHRSKGAVPTHMAKSLYETVSIVANTGCEVYCTFTE